MKFKCNGCDQPIQPPRLWGGEKKFSCNNCGMKYEQIVVREIKEISE